MIRVKTTLAALAVGLWPGGAAALSCEETRFEDKAFAVCRIDMATDDLRLFHKDAGGDVYGHFGRIDDDLATKGARLGFAMNAGMYHDDRSPVGHYVENGVEVQRVIPNAGPGNFGLLPNGVFCIRDGRADVIETLTFQKTGPDCLYATQSGPMLVIDGELHPRFLPDSTSRYIRNGVGTSADGQKVVFAISDDPVTFHTFGRFFRDALKLDQALFLDGNISRLYATDLGRSDFGWRMGPIVGVVVPQ